MREGKLRLPVTVAAVIAALAAVTGLTIALTGTDSTPGSAATTTAPRASTTTTGPLAVTPTTQLSVVPAAPPSTAPASSTSAPSTTSAPQATPPPTTEAPVSTSAAPTVPTTAASPPVNWRAVVPNPPAGGTATARDISGDVYVVDITYPDGDWRDMVEPVRAAFEHAGWLTTTQPSAESATIVVVRAGVRGDVTVAPRDGGVLVVYDLARDL